MFRVRVWYDARDGGETFGSFKDEHKAEECLLVLAGRPDVRKAQVEAIATGVPVPGQTQKGGA